MISAEKHKKRWQPIKMTTPTSRPSKTKSNDAERNDRDVLGH